MDGTSQRFGLVVEDQRRNKRLRKLLARIGNAMGHSAGLSGLGDSQAAYRLFSNDRGIERRVIERLLLMPGLMFRDMTEFSYKGEVRSDRHSQE